MNTQNIPFEAEIRQTCLNYPNKNIVIRSPGNNFLVFQECSN